MKCDIRENQTLFLNLFRAVLRLGLPALLAFGAALTQAAPFAYITNQGSFDNTVSVIDTANNTVTVTVPVGNQPLGVAVTPDGAFVYVTNRFSNNVSVIATASNTVTATVTVGSFPLGVAVTPDGAFVYVANQGSNSVSVIAAASNTVTATVPVGAAPGALGQFIGPDIEEATCNERAPTTGCTVNGVPNQRAWERPATTPSSAPTLGTSSSA